MYLIYIDESGDLGRFIPNISSNSPHFILSGIIVPQDDWGVTLDRLKSFRAYVKDEYGLPLKEEIHASELIRVNKTAYYTSIKKKDRISILLDFSVQMDEVFKSGSIINVCIDKQAFPLDSNFLELAWRLIINRFDAFLQSQNDKGIIISDAGLDNSIRTLLRKMRQFNPLTFHLGKNAVSNIVEDIILRDSKDSYFIQATDCVAHLLYRREYPKGSLKKYGLDKAFNQLKPLFWVNDSDLDVDGIIRK